MRETSNTTRGTEEAITPSPMVIDRYEGYFKDVKKTICGNMMTYSNNDPIAMRETSKTDSSAGGVSSNLLLVVIAMMASRKTTRRMEEVS